MTKIRVRFAPSPTGFLHVGGLRTALFNYLFAAHNQGKFILRIEDTDQNRKVERAVENLVESLAWAGVEFDEGPGKNEIYGPYIQSERLPVYKEQIDFLLRKNHAYRCFCTSEELEETRKIQQQKNLSTSYNGRCRTLTEIEIMDHLDKKTPFTVRMKIDQQKVFYEIEDLIRGNVRINADQLDDSVILKSDGFPTYHLANVVDDHFMKISHVIRGEEWLPSTPKHLQLYEYFGWKPPLFAHLPLLLNEDRSKLSKRQGDVATEDYKNKGYLPEAMINFIALLGWNPGDDQEIFNLEELISRFTLERVGKAGSVFDLNKLKWMNQQYMKKKSVEELLSLIKPFIKDVPANIEDNLLISILTIIKDSLVCLADFNEKSQIFFQDSPELKDENLKEKISSEETRGVFVAFVEEASQLDNLTAESFGQIMKKIQKTTGIKGMNLWMPIRIAITHAEQGPDLKAMAEFFGKDKCIRMINNLIN